MPAHSHNNKFMRSAITLAKKGAGQVSPNPLVGAVLVKHGRVVGKGYHKFFGGPHAEVVALSSAENKARGADLYVTLEPCCHQGKTPPCVDILIEHGIRRVHIGMLDPNPRVHGRGVKKLKKAGIEVEVGLLEQECAQLNEAFIKYITANIPFVILKAALTLDGKIATCTGNSKWITGEESRKRGHRMRYEADAVMVGSGTIITDDPLLTVRLYKGVKKNPLRIVVDSSLSIPLTSRVMQPGLAEKTIIATSPRKAATAKAQTIRDRGAEVLAVKVRVGRIDLAALFTELGKRGIATVLIEGGSELNASALKSGLVDKIMFFYAPKIIGGRDSLSAIGGDSMKKIADALQLQDISIQRIDCDFLVEGYLRKAEG